MAVEFLERGGIRRFTCFGLNNQELFLTNLPEDFWSRLSVL